MAEELYNAANPKHVKNRKRDEERISLRDLEAMKFVMTTPLGRHFVWALLGETGIFSQPFTGNSGTFFNCGRQDIGHKLQAQLEENVPREFIEMWREHLIEKEKDAIKDEAVRTPSAVGGNSHASDNDKDQ